MTHQIHHGHVLDILPTLPAESVQCCVTSPPYWGLRDYGTPPVEWPVVEYAPMPGLPPVAVPAMTCSLGLEPDPWAFIGHLVAVFRAVRDVLRDDGTCWVNLGDCYAQDRGGTTPPAETLAGGKGGRMDGGARVNRDRFDGFNPTRAAKRFGAKHKDLLLMPARLALALQADGWWLRSDIIWHKRAPMPESTTDRPTSAHEHVFLLAKSARYFYDAEAVRQPAKPESVARMAAGYEGNDPERDAQHHHGAHFQRGPGYHKTTANLRNVWTLGPEPYPAAHFATFPSEIPRRAILAGTRPDDVVLDPFVGSGTTLLVAHELGRHGIGIDLSDTYIAEHVTPRLEAATAQGRLAL